MFLKARAHATIGYLNLCIAFQKLYRRHIARKVAEKRLEIAQMDLTIGRYVNCGQETYVLQINGYVIGSGIPITALIGSTIENVVIVPGKIINILTKK